MFALRSRDLMELGVSRPTLSKLLSSLSMWDETIRLTGNENQADVEQMKVDAVMVSG